MDEVIGTHVRYFDYLDAERFGTVVAAEPVLYGPGDLAWLYIEDEEPEYNIHQDIVFGKLITYAEIRVSNEVDIDERN